MAKEGFRRQLKQEAEQWQKEGLISADLFQQIADRYEFNTLAPNNQNFTVILYSVAGILIGLGVITFVAANWQDLDRNTKVFLLFGWLIGINTIGFHLWQRTNQFRRIGQGLLLTGGLSLGAVIALTSQIFNLSGPWYGLYLIWAVGVIVMGASLEFQTLTMLGLILLGIGYIGYIRYSDLYGKEFNLISSSMPCLSILLIGLAYWLKSRAVFVLVVFLWIISVFENIWNIKSYLAWVIPTIILWGYDETLKLDRLGSFLGERKFEPIARVISVLLGTIVLYIYSFRYSVEIQPKESIGLGEQLYFGLMVGISFYVLVSQFFLVSNNLNAKLFLGIIGVFTFTDLLIWKESDYGSFTVLALINNCLLAILSIGLIRIGIEQAHRRNFWLGIVFLCLQIISRTFEYNTDLLFKAFMFGLCGIGILVLGIWFERYLQNLSSEANP